MTRTRRRRLGPVALAGLLLMSVPATAAVASTATAHDT